jgi:hypothetical protein
VLAPITSMQWHPGWLVEHPHALQLLPLALT